MQLKFSKVGFKLSHFASVSLFTAGAIAWYTHLYGNLNYNGDDECTPRPKMTTNSHATTSTHRNGGNNNNGSGSSSRLPLEPQVLNYYFFCLTIFFTIFFLHLELPRWRRTATPPAQHTAATAVTTAAPAAVGARASGNFFSRLFVFFTIFFYI
jgi:hypothetical protein